jgi:hypothetical protein
MVGCNWLPNDVAKTEMIEEFIGKFDTLMICWLLYPTCARGRKAVAMKKYKVKDE